MEEKLTFSNIIGKMLLVGITRKSHEGELIAYEQYHGIIIYADKDRGITIKNSSGVEYTIPPQLSNIHRAEPGIYKEETTGVVIHNPDFISSWIINNPPKKEHFN